MVAMAERSQVSQQEIDERKPWTLADWREAVFFLGHTSGLVGAAILLYSIGPALGVAVIAVCVAVGSFLSRRYDSNKNRSRSEESGECAATANRRASHCANPSWLRCSRSLTPTALTMGPVQQQGA
jgi:hypothetical protein